jgi:hypothetical protein
MNRYKSSQKWRKVGRGDYKSPDGAWRAISYGHSKWFLFALDGCPVTLGPYVSLAECQEWAEGRA